MIRAGAFVLVTGGKGGVGKTTLAANLAVALARGGASVLLADLDLGLGNLDVLLGLERRAPIEDLLAGRARLCDCVVRGPAGVHVLPAASGAHELAVPDARRRARLCDEIARAAERYAIVVGDAAAGIGEDVLGFASAADRVLVVTTPDPAAVTDAYATLKALDAWSRARGLEVATPEIVVNLVSGVEEARGVAARLRQTAERFLARSPRFAGFVPRSRAVLAAASARAAFVESDPGCGASARVASLAERLLPSALKASAGDGR